MGSQKKNLLQQKLKSFLDSGTKWRDFHPEITISYLSYILDVLRLILYFVKMMEFFLFQCEMQSATGIENLKNQDVIVMSYSMLRIRLEELREKVLLEKMRTTTYPDSEQELIMPGIGYLLLHNYADQIQNWGWICNIHSQASGSFTRNLNLIHKQPTYVTLLLVTFSNTCLCHIIHSKS
ncbi:uncharacterized protein LOC129875047 [Solanum dulcamara]|uniref:uncharacterized protein LOC129875047 n=1 Tax=Solanum dulcamara TaxID=45834 RepID=UPI002486ACAE|nr:uncharacterized protein LOC129875047 [Solanum dulcamara]